MFTFASHPNLHNNDQFTSIHSRNRSTMPTAALSQMLDPASEDEFARSDAEMLLTPDSAVENIAPSKRKAGRPKGVTHSNTASKITKVKAPSRRTSGASVMDTKKGAVSKSKRAALAEKTNLANASDTEEVDDFEIDGLDGDSDMKRPRGDVEEAPAKPAKRGRAKKVKGDEVEVTKGRKGAKAEQDDEITTPGVTRQSKLAPKATGTKKPKVSKRAPSVEPAKVITETQPEPMEIVETQEEEEFLEPTPRPVARMTNRARSVSKQRQPLMSHRRAGSASDTERAGTDSTLR